MLALRGDRLPLVNPAAFHYGGGSLWITTSRHAAKIALARRDPRGAFFADGATRSLLLQGTLEIYDPLSFSSQLRALVDAPSYVTGLTGYTLKNASFVAGYLFDLTHIPREWLPYNRVVLRLIPSDFELMDVPQFPEALTARVPAVPADVSRRLAGVPRGYGCWMEEGRPVLAPALWEVDRGQVMVAPTGRRPRAGLVGALVVESHHRLRPSLVVGACVRGTFAGLLDPEAVAERYAIDPAKVPPVLGLTAERVTWWRGFQVSTVVPRASRRLRVAEA